MRLFLAFGSPLLALLTLASSAHAATLYVSPTGTAMSGCTRDAPCDLKSVSGSKTTDGLAMAGDTVILMDGVYKEQLYVKNSGTASAWITFQADECATPIIEGQGVGPTDDNEDAGVTSDEATYVRFVGLVSRGWNIGFGNGWTGSGTTNSNGHFEFKYCIGDGNGRTGFTFFSATGIHVQNCISSHNGSSTAHSWSSGITLYETQGGASQNIIEGSVSFENMDGEKHTDGSGFIVDEQTAGATFVNNIAFGNAGSCFRLTKSGGTKFINNTCYHNARDGQDQGPSNPGEIYFTDDASRSNVSIINNVFLATGSGPGAQPVFGQPQSGWSNNITGTGAGNYFTAAEGTNPDFTLSSSASNLIGKGSSNGAPTTDIGFDPKCLVKKTPTLVGQIAKGSWWQYSIDIEYIQSIGGVAKCFNPQMRSGTPDIGAYKNGAVQRAGMCTPTMTGGGAGGAGGTGGATNAGGATSVGGGSAAGAGGAMAAGAGGAATIAGAPNGGGNGNVGGGAGAATAGSGPSGGGAPSGGASSSAGSSAGGALPGSAAGTSSMSGGQFTSGGSTSLGTGGSAMSAGTTSNPGMVTTGGSSAGAAPGGDQGGGCTFHGSRPDPWQSLAGLGLFGLGVLRVRRRRAQRTTNPLY